ncbi:hypothetical protein [Actinomadura sp. NTSP31]|uniref:hypothetical protein n=1 Tax=Actinomadura sp. NTSP31 TaxID=1735447 RepID=UPI0035BFD52C
MTTDAARHRSPQDVAALRKLLTRLKRSATSTDSFMRANWALRDPGRHCHFRPGLLELSTKHLLTCALALTGRYLVCRPTNSGSASAS